MSENPELDAAALRREARRRRILENSENRLKLITGSATKLEEKPVTPTEEIKNTCNVRPSKHVNEIFENSVTSHNSTTDDPIAQINEFLKSDNPEQTKEIFTEKEQIEEKTYLDTIIEKRLHYVLLAVIVHVLLYINMGFMFYENVICPFYTVKLIEVLVFKKKQQNSSNLFMALFMAGLNPTVVSTFQKFYSVLTTILADFFLYIFTIVLGFKLMYDNND